MNKQDSLGNTPLHLAVENDAIEAIRFLLEIPVDTSVLNEKKQAPIHLATELNRVETLRAMSPYRQVIDIQQGGEHGRSALHLAAIYDHEECATILISEFGASPRRPCNNGYYPIHEAAKNASSKTMEVFLQWGESEGCSREEMISFYDSEGNVPLHSAVHGGDKRAVELCLKSGAKISTQQHDLSTPVHLACSQGALNVIKLMFGMQPSEKIACLMSCDIQKMTPLHCAAMFNHPEIVEYLIIEGSSIDPLDKENRSPLLLAATRAGWKTVLTLIRLNANVNLKDMNSRNVLHFVIMNGGPLEDFSDLYHVFKQLLNEKDNIGCSPLHYASMEGHVRSLENLIQLGACINLKNNKNESPLHFAAKYGRFNTVRQLLNSEKGAFIINESDGDGMTPLHIASQQGHTKVVQLLLNRGALLHRDHNGRTPLHLAAMNGYTHTVQLLHSVHSHLIDQPDKDKNTALHLATMENKSKSIILLLSMDCKLLYNALDMSAIDYAIYYKHPECALVMLTHEKRASEIMHLRSEKHPCVVLALIACMPNVFEAVQGKCITRANCKKDSKSFYIKYHFDYYQKSPEEIARLRLKLNDPKFRPQPLSVVNAMVSHGRVELLAHPLTQKYLEMKWNSYGKYFHMAAILFYCIFLTFITMFSSSLMATQNIMNDNTTEKCSQTYNETHIKNNSFIKHEIYCDRMEEEITPTPMMYVSAIGILIYNSVSIFREACNIHQQKLQYLLDPGNIVTWLLCICSIIMIFPISAGHFCNTHVSAAAITVFLSWFQLLLLLQHFDHIGIYVVMFLEILQTLIKVLLVFSILIIAFGLAFYILLSRGHHLSFSSIPMSLMRTFAMMLGEIDFVGTYVHPYYMAEEHRWLPYPFPAFLILGIFMVLMPILLMNLLIGLAVGDIESVRRNAQLKRLAMQVLLHTELEGKLPQCILDRVDNNYLIEYPNEAKCKSGILDFVLRKWFYNPFTEEGLDALVEKNDDLLIVELEKQKRRMKNMTRVLDQQHKLIRLIVQKMEIKTEADDVDEGSMAENSMGKSN
ncbi:transient receptor potential cation channel subfamily A member 1-like isoform X1 [Arctopsyche grandis]|uniref:transient receptor potential cation channel subfamily A member 1-like isoform X1 n=1 Tax=Arctopsyche grandis TaxID=121162 RepID=UPI00406D84BF